REWTTLRREAGFGDDDCSNRTTLHIADRRGSQRRGLAAGTDEDERLRVLRPPLRLGHEGGPLGTLGWGEPSPSGIGAGQAGAVMLPDHERRKERGGGDQGHEGERGRHQVRERQLPAGASWHPARGQPLYPGRGGSLAGLSHGSPAAGHYPPEPRADTRRPR